MASAPFATWSYCHKHTGGERRWILRPISHVDGEKSTHFPAAHGAPWSVHEVWVRKEEPILFLYVTWPRYKGTWVSDSVVSHACSQKCETYVLMQGGCIILWQWHCHHGSCPNCSHGSWPKCGHGSWSNRALTDLAIRSAIPNSP